MLLSSCKIALPQDLFQKLIGDPAQCRVQRRHECDSLMPQPEGHPALLVRKRGPPLTRGRLKTVTADAKRWAARAVIRATSTCLGSSNSPSKVPLWARHTPRARTSWASDRVGSNKGFASIAWWAVALSVAAVPMASRLPYRRPSRSKLKASRCWGARWRADRPRCGDWEPPGSAPGRQPTGHSPRARGSSWGCW